MADLVSQEAATKFTATDVQQACPEVLEDLSKRINGHLDTAAKYDTSVKHSREKAKQNRISAGIYLAQAYAACDEDGFAAFHKKLLPNLGRTRIFELIAIGAGRKSVEGIQKANRDRKAKQRAKERVRDNPDVTDSAPKARVDLVESDDPHAAHHRAKDTDRDVVVIDYLRQSKPPFNPHEIIAGIAGILKDWGVQQVTGDAYAGNFIPSAFARHGIAYQPAKLSASELYIAALPAFTSGSLSLLDQADVVTQLVNLRRKIGSAGKETVLHMRGQHDDLANALCGLIHICTPAVFNVVDVANVSGVGVVSQPRIHFGDPGVESETWQAWQRTQNYARAPDGGLGRGNPSRGGNGGYVW